MALIPRANQLRPFGRKGTSAAVSSNPRSTAADDLKLFAATFACGFLFVSIYLA